MKTTICNLTCLLLLIIVGVLRSSAQGTAFTYQGRLNDVANPANGLYDLQFAIFDGASGGTIQGTPLISPATDVSNGLFAVTLDFGSGV